MIRLVLSVTILVLMSCGASAKEFPRPLSYAEAVGDRYIFVMLGPAEIDAAATPDDAAKLAELRQKYPASGLYPIESTEPVWTTVAPYVPAANAFPSTDGKHLVLVEGDWWTTKEYVAPKRLPDTTVAEQLAAPAISFYEDGKLTKRYTVQELVTDPSRFEHTPEHVLWAAGAALNDDTSRFVLMTQDANRITFDAATGEIVSRREAGFGNPLASWILAVSGALALLILAVWAWLVFGRRKRVTAPATPLPS